MQARSPWGLPVEARCDRHCLRPFVMSLTQYQGRVQVGSAEEIFCTRCLQDIPPSLREVSGAASGMAPHQAD